VLNGPEKGRLLIQELLKVVFVCVLCGTRTCQLCVLTALERGRGWDASMRVCVAAVCVKELSCIHGVTTISVQHVGVYATKAQAQQC
jgi:hypothetical protein